ncbi:alpha/beta-hydrolase lipase region domain-containing protein [Phthorimaea operculella]|nr:alpha/beta-hydrolase lipase region domain-containing protein [Phthorimaea operculella]
MKIICLLLCLALAQGHIFRRQQKVPKVDRYNVDSLDNTNQRQKELYQGPLPREYMIRSRPTAEWNQWYPMDYSPEEIKHTPVYDRRRSFEQERQQYPQIYQDSDYERVPHVLRSKDSIEDDVYRPETLVKSKYASRPLYSQMREQKIAPMIHTSRLYTQNEPVSYDDVSYESYRDIPRTHEYTNEYQYPVMYADEPTRNNIRQEYKEPIYSESISWKNLKYNANPNIDYDAMQAAVARIYNDAQISLKHRTNENKQIFHKNVEKAMQTVNEDVHLNATELLIKHQYAVETHTVKTEDGYFLTLFRIPPTSKAVARKQVVFLMHGLLGSADDWLLMGPSKSLAYILADAGYEVWLGNARGNRYSRRHVTMDPAQPEFWKFSNDEIALYDLPAMIDYVLKTSEHEKMYYVGYNLGTTVFFALAAARPEYNNKIIKMYALSPMVYMSQVRSPMIRAIAPNSPFYEQLNLALGNGEFRPNNAVLRTLGSNMCMREVGCRHVCSNVNYVMGGIDVDNVDVRKIPVILSHLPAGGSTRQVKQYGQAYVRGDFARFDYGPQTNMEVYGTIEPTKYDLSKVMVPVTLFYSSEDWLAAPEDVERLARELPNKEVLRLDNYSTYDFLFGNQVAETKYNWLMSSINANTKKITV